MRNIAYLFFVIIFVVVGFMIIFRVKIDPKTVTTIQNALPKIIFALILITFSYAIAGFLIDLMYLLIHLMFAVVVSAGMSPGVAEGAQKYMLGTNSWILGISGLVPGLISGSFGAIGLALMVANFFAQPEVAALTTMIAMIVGTILAPGIGTAIGLIGGLASPVVFPVIVGVLGFIIIVLMILWALFKTWLMLLNAYANIILGIIFAPVYLMLEAVPGQSQFWNWMRGMLANLVAFPAVIGILLITMIITAQGAAYGFASSMDSVVKILACSVPQLRDTIAKPVCDAIAARNLTTGFVPPLIGGNNLATMQALIGLAILLTMPKVVDILQEWFKVPPFKYGGAWMEPGKWTYNQFSERFVQPWKMYREGRRKFEMGLSDNEPDMTSLPGGRTGIGRVLQNLPEGMK